MIVPSESHSIQLHYISVYEDAISEFLMKFGNCLSTDRAFYNIKPDCQLGILQNNLKIFSSFVQYLKL